MGYVPFPFSYITSLLYMLLGGFLFLWLPLGVVFIGDLSVAWEKAGNSGLELHDVGYVY